MDEPREIDWSTAAVKNGKLTVELTGEQSRGWSEHMEGVVTRLGSKRWPAIKVGRRRIRVSGVDEDSVDEVRHLLESAVQQTNVDLVEAKETGEDGGRGDEPTGADQALTDAFRSFAPADPD
ncbi:MAG: hypothetical protein ACR2KV_01855 [Solirubrobacteraceae bacterium]